MLIFLDNGLCCFCLTNSWHLNKNVTVALRSCRGVKTIYNNIYNIPICAVSENWFKTLRVSCIVIVPQIQPKHSVHLWSTRPSPVSLLCSKMTFLFKLATTFPHWKKLILRRVNWRAELLVSIRCSNALISWMLAKSDNNKFNNINTFIWYSTFYRQSQKVVHIHIC